MAAPRVGVVVLDHDGSELTLRCLRSLAATDWPGGRLKVVLVDNSPGPATGGRPPGPGLAERVRTEAPDVRVVRAGGNRGFAGGCNLGIRALGGTDFVALLNNDATVGRGWLAPLVEAFGDDPAVGATSPKILFEAAYVDVALESPADRPGRGDRRPLGVEVSGARLDGDDAWGRLQLVRGFWGLEHRAGGGPPFQWTDGSARLRVPARADGRLPRCELCLAAPAGRRVLLASGDRRSEHRLDDVAAWYEVGLGGKPFDVVNNVGSVLLEDGSGADRGYLEPDEGQYDKGEEVFAWCGAAVVLDRRYLDAVGTFDERFFLYYEDFDLAWRGRAQGWRYRYVPESVVRHLHSASTVEGSRLAEHHKERNRLLMLTRNAPAPFAGGAVVRHALITGSYARRDVVHPPLRGRAPSWEIVGRRARALAAYLRLLPGALAQRRRLRRRQLLTDDELMRWRQPAAKNRP